MKHTLPCIADLSDSIYISALFQQLCPYPFLELRDQAILVFCAKQPPVYSGNSMAD